MMSLYGWFSMNRTITWLKCDGASASPTHGALASTTVEPPLVAAAAGPDAIPRMSTTAAAEEPAIRASPCKRKPASFFWMETYGRIEAPNSCCQRDQRL